HPHILRIHELGEHGGQPFIAMELLEGRTVKQLIEEGPIPAARVLNFARQVAEALDVAHRRGIIHRDIKPANLFVTHGDRIKVLDFGLAKIASDTAAPVSRTASSPTLTSVHSPELTRTGSTVGTASYMAPEQAQGQPVDARTDLFSLGAVLYEMATARRAFGGDDIPLIVMKVMNGDVGPPRAINDSVPPALEAIIQKLMTVDPQQRYQTAGELLADVNNTAQQLEIEARKSDRKASAAIPPLPRRRLNITVA